MTSLQKKYNISNARGLELAVAVSKIKNIDLSGWQQAIIDDICRQCKITADNEKAAVKEMIYTYISNINN